ncbi:hypothetical protein LXL04_027274 [Taraxacum kok-saghyz]
MTTFFVDGDDFSELAKASLRLRSGDNFIPHLIYQNHGCLLPEDMDLAQKAKNRVLKLEGDVTRDEIKKAMWDCGSQVQTRQEEFVRNGGIDLALGFTEIVLNTFRLKYFPVLGNINRMRSVIAELSMRVCFKNSY